MGVQKTGQQQTRDMQYNIDSIESINKEPPCIEGLLIVKYIYIYIVNVIPETENRRYSWPGNM